MSATERFEHYEVLKREDGSLFELGRGAMGITYKALDTDLECVVALKIISPSTIANQDAEQRFFREARAAAQLRHPNIASVFRLGKTGDGAHYYAMEFCEGQTLQQLVEQSGPIECRRALQFTLQITKALIVAEERRLVHRDLKPANLIVTRRSDEGEVIKVIDFGLAKTTTPDGTMWSSMGTQGFIGTAHFASPEQIEDQPVDTRSDIYSLGSTLWFMLLGKPPFQGSLARIMSQHLTATPDFSPLHGVPVKVVALLRRMLEKNAEDRPQTALELRSEIIGCLETAEATEEAETSKTSPPRPEFVTREPAPEKVWAPSLLELLRMRGVLSPAEALCIADVLAAHLDLRPESAPSALRIQDVTIHFRDSPTAEQARARLRELAIAWPAFDLAIGPREVLPPSDALDPSEMTTIVPGEESVGDRAQQLARLLYELMGGVAGARYVPLARLGEAGNAVLKRATIVGLAGYPTLRDLIEELRKAGDLATPSAPLQPLSSTPLQSPPPPAEPIQATEKLRPKFRLRPALKALAALAALLMIYAGVKTFRSGLSGGRGAAQSGLPPNPGASPPPSPPSSQSSPPTPSATAAPPLQFTIYDKLGAGQISESVWIYLDDQTEPSSTLSLTPQQARGAAVIRLPAAGRHAFSVKTESVAIDLTNGSKKITSFGRWENDFRGGEKYDLSAAPQENVDSYRLEVTPRN